MQPLQKHRPCRTAWHEEVGLWASFDRGYVWAPCDGFGRAILALPTLEYALGAIANHSPLRKAGTSIFNFAPNLAHHSFDDQTGTESLSRYRIGAARTERSS